MRQNFYVKINSLGQIMDISNTQKPSYIPVAVDLSHLDLFKTKSHRVTYNTVKQALEYAPVVHAYGVYWDGSSNPQLQRIGEAKGLRAGINGAENDFDYKAPWSGIHQVKDSMGNQYMSIPPFYVKRTQDPKTGAEKLLISPNPVRGWYVPMCFVNINDHSIHNIWVGKYLDSTSDKYSYMTSKSGTNIDNSNSIDDYRFEIKYNNNILAHHRLSNPQNGPCSLMDYHTWCVLQDLFTVEFATLDSKAVFYNAQGDDIKIPSSQVSLPVKQPNITGTNDGLPGTSNWNSSAGVVNYRGIENIFGYNGTWCDGINGTNCSIGMDYTKYNDSGNGYALLSYSGKAANSGSGDVMKEGLDPRYPDIRIPIQYNNNSYTGTTYYCDSAYVPYGPSVYVGGGGYGASDDVGLWYADGDASEDYSYSARLVYHPFG